jgi:hypothetical protein
MSDTVVSEVAGTVAFVPALRHFPLFPSWSLKDVVMIGAVLLRPTTAGE